MNIYTYVGPSMKEIYKSLEKGTAIEHSDASSEEAPSPVDTDTERLSGT
jgi:hypothetical protein